MQRIVIVGGGAGGLALATQLGKRLGKKGLAEITLVDAAPRLLAQLPERLSESALRELRKLAIEVHTDEKVIEVTPDSLKMASGKVISTSLSVWAAGVKSADFLSRLGGAGAEALGTNRLN